MTQKRGLGRGLGALIPGASSAAAPESELRTRTTVRADQERTASGRPVDMFFSGQPSASSADDAGDAERPVRERRDSQDLAGDMARAAKERRTGRSSPRTTSTSTPAKKARSTSGAADPEESAEAAEGSTTSRRRTTSSSASTSSSSAPSGSTAKSPTSSTRSSTAKSSDTKSSTGRSARAGSSTGSGGTAKRTSTTASKRASTTAKRSSSASTRAKATSADTAAADAVAPDTSTADSAPAEVSSPSSAQGSAAASSRAPHDAPVVDVDPGHRTAVHKRGVPAPGGTTSEQSTDAPPVAPAGDSARGETAAGLTAPAPATLAGESAADDAIAETSHEDPSTLVAQRDDLVAVPGAEFAEVPIHEIRENPRNPRTMFDEDELDELAFSLREVGVLQPVVVRPIPVTEDGESFELVMGERRWRAARRAGLTSIPAIIRETSDDDLLRDALLENLHRTQLNPLEEAAAYQQLLEDFGCTQDELGERIGRSRPQITNTLRLLRLPPLVQRRLASGALSAGHARALLSLDDPSMMEELAQRIVTEGLSVRAVERLVAGRLEPATTRTPRRSTYDPHVVDLTSRLSNRLETPVRIDVGKRKGKITLEFANLEDLERLVETMGLTTDRESSSRDD